MTTAAHEGGARPPSAAGSALHALESWSAAITQRVALVGVLAMLIIAFATIVDILLRAVFSAPIAGLGEAEGLALAVAVAACFPAGAAQRVNLTIDLLGDRVGVRALGWFKAFGGVLLLVFYVLLAWRVGAYAFKLQARAAETVYLHLPLAPFIWAVTLFLGVTALVQLITLAAAVSRALAGVAAPDDWAMGASATSRREPLPAIASARFTLTMVGLLAFAGGAVTLLSMALDPFASIAQASPGWSALAVVTLVWVLLVLYVPLAAAMGLLGLLTAALFTGGEPALNVLGNESVQFLSNAQVAVVPMFLMMGSFAVVAGMSEDIYDLAHALLARLRGGLALATIGGCAGFGALTGSSLATVATIGRVALPEMRARGYSAELSTGCVAAGGTLGALVPPSIPLIFYAFLTESSIGKLFIAAVVPALLAVALYMLAIVIQIRIAPGSAPPAADRLSYAAIGRALKRAWPTLALFALVLGGIYGGVFTETEAAAVGAVGAFGFAVARGRITREKFLGVMGETTATTALLFLIILGVLTFSFAIGITGLPQRAMTFMQALDWAPIAALALIVAIYIALGCIMDSNTVMFVTVPIVTPIVIALGYDVVWWGVVNLVVLEMGLITPPFGIHLFVLKSLAGADAPVTAVYRGVAPFIVADAIKLALLIAFPVIALWLPKTMS